MKIALLSPGHPVYDAYPEGGGIQHQIQGLGGELVRRGHDVHVLCRAVNRSSIGNEGVSFHRIGGILMDEVASVLLFSQRASKVIRRLKPDVVSAFERFSAYFPSLQRYPFTFTTENYDAFRYYQRFSTECNPLNALLFPWKRRLEEGVMRRSQVVVALTQSIEDYLASIGIRHVKVIPNGVASAEYKDLGDDRYVLYAGRLDAPKRVDLLIRSFARLTGLHEEHHLLIVGRGTEKDKLVQLAHELGIAPFVEFMDWVPRERLRQLLGNCTAFVLPSVYEALPVVLLEAMACSKAVIAMNVAGPKDVIVDGYNGMLAEKQDAGALAENLGRCLEDDSLRAALGTNARRTIVSDYDFRQLGGRLLGVYENVLSSDRVLA